MPDFIMAASGQSHADMVCDGEDVLPLIQESSSALVNAQLRGHSDDGDPLSISQNSSS